MTRDLIDDQGELGQDARALAADLRRAIRGEVGFDAGARALFAQDASHYRQPPIGVVMPVDNEDVEAALEVCRRHDAAVLTRGAGTSLAGQGCNTAVVIDVSRHLNRILEIDPDRRVARVEPGVVLDTLRDAAEEHGLTFGPDPSTHASCTMAGMIGNNACGVHSLMAGRTSDNVEAMEVLTYDGARLTVGPTDDATWDARAGEGGRVGEISRKLRQLRDDTADLVRERYPDIPRRVSGYNLDDLLPERGSNLARALSGSEGTCVLHLDTTVRLVRSPPAPALLVLGYEEVAAAADDVPAILAHAPIGLEGTAASLIDNMRAKGIEAAGVKLLPDGRGWLLVEFGAAETADATAQAMKLLEELSRRSNPPTSKLIEDRAVARKIWSAREAAVGAGARLADGQDTWSGWEDAAVPPDKLGDYLRDFRALTERFDYFSTVYGHFGQGCVHTRLNFDLRTADGIAKYRHFVEEAAELVVRHGGSLSGEHGDGHSRAELLEKMFGRELIDAFARFKRVWDPAGRMNPGRIVDPEPLDARLRFGAGYTLPQIDTHFTYPDDEGGFARAVARCIGVGKCRREEGGTMCPSYMVTREEQHTTRGRARLLYEMAEGRLPDGWRNEQVKEALDLCLACKGCSNDCPASVDVATYKAEFFSHYYEHQPRPLQAYAFGWIHRWARLAAIAPGLANFFTHAPGLSRLAKGAIHVPWEREMPRFARRTFRRWFRSRSVAGATNGRRVLLWPDTFNNHFTPHVARAAVEVLQRCGCEIVLPERRVCCGRPLYDFGMLELARRLLLKTLDTIGEEIERGTPIIVLEPSCAAVFRDELMNLLPDHPLAPKLRDQTLTLAEFLASAQGEHDWPKLARDVLFHGHCHHKAVMSTEPDLDLLRRIAGKVEAPETGCCGMAGSFGFKDRHYDVSVAAGERVLLPAVREAGEQTLIVTDGFSCREQIRQLTSRAAMHLAEVLALARRPSDTERKSS